MSSSTLIAEAIEKFDKEFLDHDLEWQGIPKPSDMRYFLAQTIKEVVAKTFKQLDSGTLRYGGKEDTYMCIRDDELRQFLES